MLRTYANFVVRHRAVILVLSLLLSVMMGLQLRNLNGVHLDPFNNLTPILILAVAAGHAVQMLKRYYEEYDRLHLRRQSGAVR